MKTHLITQAKLSSSRPSLPLQTITDINFQKHRFMPVTVTGHFITPHLLLENQYHNRAWGFRIFSPFQLTTGDIILIDRGWSQAVSRQTPPSPTTPQLTNITGYINRPGQGLPLTQPLNTQQQTLQIVYLNFKDLQDYWQRPVADFSLSLESPLPGDPFITTPYRSNMSPIKHYSYASQWFLLACVTTFYAFKLRKTSWL